MKWGYDGVPFLLLFNFVFLDSKFDILELSYEPALGENMAIIW